MVRKTLLAVVSSSALLLAPALGMANEDTVQKGDLSQTGTGAAANLAQAEEAAEGGVATGAIVGVGVAAAVGGGLCAAFCGGGGGGGGSGTSTTTATSTTGGGAE